MKSNDKFNWIPAELLWDAYINMSTDNMTDFIQFYFFSFITVNAIIGGRLFNVHAK